MKNLPPIYVNKIKKINNNKETYYSYLDNDVVSNETINIRKKINELFKSNNFVYKKNFNIKTLDNENTYTIISKSIDYLLCIDGKKIYIKDIIDINEI